MRSPPSTHEGSAPGGRGWLGVGITLGAVAVFTVVVLAVDPLREGIVDAVSGDSEALREDLRALGAVGVLVVLGLVLAHVFVFYPTEVLNAAAGFVYGFWVALPLMLAGWVVNGIVCYVIGSHAARPFLFSLLGAERFLRGERIVARGGVTLLLAIRLLPVVPFSLVSYVAGAARVPFWTYVWTTAVGFLPLTAAFVYVGSRLEELSLTDPVLLVGAAAIAALLVVGHYLARRIGWSDDVPMPEPPPTAAAPDQEAAATAASTSSSDGEP